MKSPMIRNTRQRTVIRKVFEDTNRPMGAPEVLEAAKPLLAGLGIATVYRTIKALLEEGWLTPVELPGEPPRYELSGKDHHHHFHCRDCGKVYELEGCVDNLKKMTPPGFRLLGHDVILFGLCVACLRAARA